MLRSCAWCVLLFDGLLIANCASVSGKIVVLDTELPVKAAFFGLIENG